MEGPRLMRGRLKMMADLAHEGKDFPDGEEPYQRKRGLGKGMVATSTL